MNRLFNMVRRRPNVIDLVIPRLSGVDGYRIQSSPNFDGSWTTLMTAPTIGYVDPNININAMNVHNLNPGTFGPPVRIIFDPATYSLTDTNVFWLRFQPVTGGTPGTAGAPTLVLPAQDNHGLGLIVIHGNAPNAADISGSLQIDLPGVMQDFRVHNEDATNNLYLASESSGPETMLKPYAGEQLTSMLAKQGSIWVRGGGGVVAFSATFTGAFTH